MRVQILNPNMDIKKTLKHSEPSPDGLGHNVAVPETIGPDGLGHVTMTSTGSELYTGNKDIIEWIKGNV